MKIELLCEVLVEISDVNSNYLNFAIGNFQNFNSYFNSTSKFVLLHLHHSYLT
jgi:hypothetical protein